MTDRWQTLRQEREAACQHNDMSGDTQWETRQEDTACHHNDVKSGDVQKQLFNTVTDDI